MLTKEQKPRNGEAAHYSPEGEGIEMHVEFLQLWSH
jgi:hypothetical protein